MPWQPLVWSFEVIDLVKLIDLHLELTEGRSHGLLVEEAEQGLMETFVLALRGRLVGLSGDRLDTEPGDVIDEMAHDPSPRRVQRDTVVRQQSLRGTVHSDSFRNDVNCGVRGLAASDVRCGRET